MKNGYLSKMAPTFGIYTTSTKQNVRGLAWLNVQMQNVTPFFYTMNCVISTVDSYY